MKITTRRRLACMIVLGLLAGPAAAQNYTCTNNETHDSFDPTQLGTCTSYGVGASAYHDGAAYGDDSHAYSDSSLAVGTNAVAGDNTKDPLAADNRQNTAIGVGALSTGRGSVALGFNALADGYNSFAGGYNARATNGGTALNGTASATGSIAIGNTSSGVGSVASGMYSISLGGNVIGLRAIGIGASAVASGTDSVGLGYFTTATANNAVALGARSFADQDNTISVGNNSLQRKVVYMAAGTADTDAVNLSQLYPIASALGAGASYTGGIWTAPAYVIQGDTYSDVGSAFSAVDTSLTNNSTAITNNSTAIGSLQSDAMLWSTTLGAFDASHGAVAQRVTNVADGTQASDAVNVSQLQAATASASDWQGVVNWFGGGASYTSGVFTAPSFVIQSSTYNNVGDAFAAVDTKLTSLQGQVDNIELTPGAPGAPGAKGDKGDKGDTGATGATGPAGSGGGADADAVHYDDSTHATATLGTKGTATKLSNVANGVTDTDAANLGQVNNIVEESVKAAQNYADNGDRQTLQQANAYTDWRVNQLDDRLDNLDRRVSRAGATASAMGLMAGTAASVQNEDVISMAVAGYRGQSAVSVGLNHRFGDRVSLTIGGAFSGGNESAVGAGLAIGLH